MNTNKIKIYRNIAGMSQDELAEALGMSKSMISKYERDIIRPPYEKLKKISELFNVKISDLIDDEGVPSSQYMSPIEGLDERVPTTKQKNMEAAVLYVAEAKCDLCGKEVPFTDSIQVKKFLKPYCTNLNRDDNIEPSDIAILCPNCYSYLEMTNDSISLIKARESAAKRASEYADKLKVIMDFQDMQQNIDGKPSMPLKNR